MRNQSITFYSDDPFSLRLFSREIRKHSSLTPLEESTIFKKVREGDRQALDRIVRANSQYVVSIAKQYSHYGLNLMDLVQEGLMALVEAAKNYDETRGFKFLTYASHWVRQSLRRAVEKRALITESIFSVIPGTECCLAEMLSGDWNDRPDAQLMC